MSGIFGLIVLVLDILAIIQIVQGKGDTEKKILWCAIILLLPVIGLVFWYLVGRKK